MANDILVDRGGELTETNVDMNVVGAGYFRTMGIPVIRGRAFSDEDRAGGPGVAIVTQTTVDRLWPDQDPLGQVLRLGRPERPGAGMEVVGVVADGRYYRNWRAETRPFLFLPLAQHPTPQASLLVRGTGGGSPDPESLRRVTAGLEPGLPPLEVTPARTLMDQALGLERTNAKVLGLFGLLAMIISAIGVYGVVSFSVSQRIQEIGVRVALGARPLDIRYVVVMGCVLPVLAGTATGWVAALGLGRFVRTFLFDVPASDPLTFGATAALLVGVGVAAAIIPAQRATRIDPIQALQVE
jgi:putative ABC transport system permease protein